MVLVSGSGVRSGLVVSKTEDERKLKGILRRWVGREE